MSAEVEVAGAAGERGAVGGGVRLLLWLGYLVAPVAWFLHLMIGYTVSAYLCARGAVWVIHGATAVFLVAALAGAACAAVAARRTRGHSRHAHFTALSGLALSASFALVILVAAFTPTIHTPCPAALEVR